MTEDEIKAAIESMTKAESTLEKIAIRSLRTLVEDIEGHLEEAREALGENIDVDRANGWLCRLRATAEAACFIADQVERNRLLSAPMS